jgi:hypothetical protein
MNTQTVRTERQGLHRIVDALSDSSIPKLASYAAFLQYEEETPNAETIAAMREAESGGGEATTIQAIMDVLNNAGN